MSKVEIRSEKAPEPIGPYSQAIGYGAMVFMSGQVPLIPGTPNLVEGSVAAQTEQVMKNLTAVAESAGITLQHIVKTTIFLTDMADFAEVNEVYGRYFKPPFPARSTIAVKALPKAARVEIEAIGLK